MEAQIHLRPVTGALHDMAALQRVLEGAPGYFRRLTGRPAGRRAARDLLAALPPGMDPEAKRVFAVMDGGRWIGCIDVIRGYPRRDTAFVGLLLIVESSHGQGRGRAAHRALEIRLGEWPECRRMALGVAAANAGVLDFWRRLGYRLQSRGEQARKAVAQEVFLMHKRLETPAPPISRASPAPKNDAIYNYRRASHRLATAGQPTAAQFARIALDGYEVVVNLLPASSDEALKDEERIVHSLGMDYVHIPVPFTRPTRAHLLAFFACLDAHARRMLFVHCAANYRVSAFLALYRVLRLGWQPDRALRDLHRIWRPDAVWQRFIERHLGWPRPSAPRASGRAQALPERVLRSELVLQKPQIRRPVISPGPLCP